MTIIHKQIFVNNFVIKMSYFCFERCQRLPEIISKSLKNIYLLNVYRSFSINFNCLLDTEISNSGCSFSRG